MTTMLRVCALTGILPAVIGGSLIFGAIAAAQTGGKASTGPAATYPSNPRGTNAPVRQVSGPSNPNTPQPYGPQPDVPIKEPGKGGNPAERPLPLPAGRVVPNQGVQGVQGVPVGPPLILKAPSWYPLPPEHATRLDEILNYWEQESDKVERYQCKFKRWEYDPVFGPKPGPDGKDVAKTYAEGLLQYKKPDKGNFHVQMTQAYTAPKTEGAKGTYEKQPDEMNEHWVCDGKSVFEFDGRKKQLIERPLPPDMQGKSIADGPLPFMFGAKAATIKERYWIRIITPQGSTGEYWLEAHPKYRQDASNFKLVQVIIDEKDFLPKKLTIFAPNYDPRTNAAKTAYVFEDRQKNWNELLRKLTEPFAKAFDKPDPPFGWKKVVDKPENANEGLPQVEVRPLNPPGNQANKAKSATPAGAQATKPQNGKSLK